MTLAEGDGFRISIRCQPDGRWRFDRDTLDRVPSMWLATLARQRNLQAERAAMREGYSDPASTMRRFLLDGVFRGDYYAAARALDLGALTSDERRDRGPILAQQLAYVLQRRGWVFYQEIPNQPAGPPPQGKAAAVTAEPSMPASRGAGPKRLSSQGRAPAARAMPR